MTDSMGTARAGEGDRWSTQRSLAETDVEIPVSVRAVVALLTVITIELVRSTGPLLEVAFDVSVVVVAGTAIATYVGAGALALLMVGATRRSDATMTVLVGVIALAIARVIVQAVTGTTRFAIGLLTISLCIAVFTLAGALLAGRQRGAGAAASAIAFGSAVAVGLQLVLGTWDAYWRHDTLGWSITTTVLVGLLAAAASACRTPSAAPTRHTPRIWVLGPAASLVVMVLANSGFASSQSGVRLAIAGPVAAAGLLMTATMIPIAQRHPGVRHAMSSSTTRVVIAALPAVAVAGVYWATGPVVLGLLVAAQLVTFTAIARAFDPATVRGSNRPAPTRTAASAAFVGLGTILPLLVFQLDYDIPLGFPNELVIVATAALVGVGALHRRTTPSTAPTPPDPGPSIVDRPTAALLTVASSVVLLGTAFAVGRAVRTDPQPDLTSDTEQLTLMSWNLHYGVSPHADVDLEQIARTIEQQNPSIVTLQEVSRGWVLGGGTDMATWLAQRLEMNVAFAPAADRQFGNAILTDLPAEDINVVELPYGNGPQQRSAISADIITPNGPVRVTSVHLQNKSHIPTRIAQIDTLAPCGAASI